jgi:hypothetical protein
VRTRPGPSVARRSSGAQPRKAKPEEVRSLNGRGEVVGVVLEVVDTLLLVEVPVGAVVVPVGEVVVSVGAVVLPVDDGEVVIEEDTTFEFTV